jgi:hypothetical protein
MYLPLCSPGYARRQGGDADGWRDEGGKDGGGRDEVRGRHNDPALIGVVALSRDAADPFTALEELQVMLAWRRGRV